jgi:hypothetical protein
MRKQTKKRAIFFNRNSDDALVLYATREATDEHKLNYGQTGYIVEVNDVFCRFFPDGRDNGIPIAKSNCWTDDQGYQNGLSQ